MDRAKGLPWALWRRQVLAVLRIEIRKSFLGRRALFIYMLAALPVFLTGMLLLVALLYSDPGGALKDVGPTMVFAGVYQFILRFSLYIGCVWVFMNLFRGEILDRSLHFYFLTPIRRELLVVGKFLSGWITAVLLFAGATAVSLVLVHLSFGVAEARQYLLQGGGRGELLAYVGVTALACLGYGAVFVLIGLLFRNPVVPALVVWGWETINYLLPAALKKISVIHYLNSVSPVTVSEGPLAILTEPTPAWLSVPGLLLLSAVTLALSGLRIRHLEIQYTSD